MVLVGGKGRMVRVFSKLTQFCTQSKMSLKTLENVESQILHTLIALTMPSMVTGNIYFQHMFILDLSL